MSVHPYLLTFGAILMTATIGYGGYLGWQMAELWYHMGEVQGRLKCGEEGE